jgi:hypothetical protein
MEVHRAAAVREILAASGRTRTGLCVLLGYSAATNPLLNWERRGSSAFHHRLSNWLRTQTMIQPSPTLAQVFPEVYGQSSPVPLARVFLPEVPTGPPVARLNPPSPLQAPSPRSLYQIAYGSLPLGSLETNFVTLVQHKSRLHFGLCLSNYLFAVDSELNFEFPTWLPAADVAPLLVNGYAFRIVTSGSGLEVTLKSSYPDELRLLKTSILTWQPDARLEEGPTVWVFFIPAFRRPRLQELLQLRELRGPALLLVEGGSSSEGCLQSSPTLFSSCLLGAGLCLCLKPCQCSGFLGGLLQPRLIYC